MSQWPPPPPGVLVSDGKDAPVPGEIADQLTNLTTIKVDYKVIKHLNMPHTVCIYIYLYVLDYDLP